MGANCPGPWGTPSQTIERAYRELERAGIAVRAVSRLYETEAVGRPGQPAYVNAAARLETPLGPEALLRRLKAIERAAGRRGGSPWGPRTLDIDLLDYKGLVRHWRDGKPRFRRPGPKPLVLPHPWIEDRPFVIWPLLDVAPKWRHPVTQKGARALLSAAMRRQEGRVIRPLDARGLPAGAELHK